MPDLHWELNVQVAGGPQISKSDTISVEAYDKIRITVEKNATNKEVVVQPSDSGDISFFLIISDLYKGENENEQLKYKLKKGANGNEEIILDGPQFFIGSGTIGLLKPAPKSLFFTSTLSEDANIEILVGRDATPKKT